MDSHTTLELQQLVDQIWTLNKISKYLVNICDTACLMCRISGVDADWSVWFGIKKSHIAIIFTEIVICDTISGNGQFCITIFTEQKKTWFGSGCVIWILHLAIYRDCN